VGRELHLRQVLSRAASGLALALALAVDKQIAASAKWSMVDSADLQLYGGSA
jgi:hypothetical protein